MLEKVVDVLESSNSNGVFEYQTAEGGWLPSTLYTWKDMIEGVKVMATDGIGDSKLYTGGGNYKYALVNIAAFLGQCMKETIMYNACDENNWSNPDVTKSFGGVAYTASMSCGQGRQSYEDYKCQKEDNAIAGGKMACDVDPNMEMRAHTQAEWYGAPPRMFCAPKSKVPKAPHWNWGKPWCPQKGGYGYKTPFPDAMSNASMQSYWNYVNGGGGCRDYDTIKAGGWNHCNDKNHILSTTDPADCQALCAATDSCNCFGFDAAAKKCIMYETCDSPTANAAWVVGPKVCPSSADCITKNTVYGTSKAGNLVIEADRGGCPNSPAALFGHPDGRKDVEGCCWWGRGVIQTTGVCNFGKLNYYLGKRGHTEGRDVLYPDIDFCRNPEAVCEPDSPPALKWIAGFFYWLNSVQSYVDKDGWVYMDKLRNWTDAGMNTGDTSYIYACSGIVNRGCYNPPCGGNVMDGGKARAANFAKVLSAMNIGAVFEDNGVQWV